MFINTIVLAEDVILNLLIDKVPQQTGDFQDSPLSSGQINQDSDVELENGFEKNLKENANLMFEKENNGKAASNQRARFF